jgi:hypothetical protein
MTFLRSGIASGQSTEYRRFFVAITFSSPNGLDVYESTTSWTFTLKVSDPELGLEFNVEVPLIYLDELIGKLHEVEYVYKGALEELLD